MSLQIQWIRIGKELPRVLEIENATFENPWGESDFKRAMDKRNHVCMVAKDDQGNVVGYMVYHLLSTGINLLVMAVDARHQGRGIGRAMVDKLKSKLTPNQRKRIVLDVRESNLGGQLFFRSMGFMATQVLKGHWDHSQEDAYRMQYMCEVPAPALAEVN
ncbi:ribosomal protein S18-alanine N-acetyltransferase [Rosistilla oblonga]|uniref:ribosomal protein S18-alanine N-acetyltransferase n=1 Tax=Rosistilla oblonga TaxID=2527990 RepID=UPI003A9878C3